MGRLIFSFQLVTSSTHLEVSIVRMQPHGFTEIS